DRVGGHHDPAQLGPSEGTPVHPRLLQAGASHAQQGDGNDDAERLSHEFTSPPRPKVSPALAAPGGGALVTRSGGGGPLRRWGPAYIRVCTPRAIFAGLHAG